MRVNVGQERLNPAVVTVQRFVPWTNDHLKENPCRVRRRTERVAEDASLYQ